jgi:ribosomal protein S8
MCRIEAPVVVSVGACSSTQQRGQPRPLVTCGPSEILLRRTSNRHRRHHDHQLRPHASAVNPANTLAAPSTPQINRTHCNRTQTSATAPPRASPSNMSLVNLAHVCSHLQNASKARLGLTSIPVSKLHVNLALGLQREGFLSSVTLGGRTPPKPFLLQAQQGPEQMEKMADMLKKEPWHAYAVDMEGEDQEKTHTEEVLGRELLHEVRVPDNQAKRRLWLGLKYWQNEPVLRNMKLISKPTRRIWLTSEDLGKITRTRESSYVQGLTHPGECMFLTTDRGVLEARECVERRMGGMALCRVWG